MISVGRAAGRLLPPVLVPPVVGEASRNVGAVAARLARVAGLSRRRVWSRPGRHHIEVIGVCQDGGDVLARQVEAALERMPGVEWARVNAPSGRVVVAVGTPEPALRDLIATVARTERTCPHEPDPEIPPPHPPEEGPRTPRTLGALASDALGLTLAAATRILPFTPVPGEVAGLLVAVDLHPKLHALADQGLRADPRADLLFPLAEAVALGLTGGWAGLVLDGAQRVVQWGEARAQLRAWAQAEHRLTGHPERAAAAVPKIERPLPKPDGPVEKYISRMLDAGAAAVATMPVVGPKRAAALGLSTLPKAPGSGREGYAAQLGRILARRGVIAMDRSVLRELDRIDTLVLDAAVLGSDRGVLADLAPLAGADTGQVAARAFALFDPAAPRQPRDADGWRLGPLEALDVENPGDTTDSRRLRDAGGLLLGLADGGTLAAVLRVEPEPAPGVDALSAAARQAGLRLIVAGDDERRYGFADAHLPGHDRLAESVRNLQRAGAMVMVVSADRAALGVADCGLGLSGPEELPPWGAHLLLGADLRVAALVVEAAGVARRMARQNIGLAMAGTGLGALGALTAPRARLPGRAVVPVNGAAALAFAHGVLRAHRLPDRTDGPTPAVTAWHLMPSATVLDQLGSGPDGLTTAEAERRRDDHGVRPDGPTGLLRAFVDELANPLTPVLAAGAVLSAAFGSPVDAALVGGVVGGSALLGAVHQHRTERSLAELLSRSSVTARVRRDGAERTVAAEELVPGDVVLLESGDAVPADCRVLESAGLEMDESSLTGESLPVGKTEQPVVAAAVADRRSMLYEGTSVAAGHGTAVVVATGAETEAGRSLAMARQAPPSSGVEARLGRLTRAAIPLAAGSAVAVAGAGLLRGVPLAQTAATAANLAVASVPEGLPFLVSAAQLAAARRLAEHGALVRNPRTIEALGRVDVLCFDKTGTLTEGQLLLAGVGDDGRYAPVDRLDDALRDTLAAALRATPGADDPHDLAQQTDRAVRSGAQAAGVTERTGAEGWEPVDALPFEPSRGYHATVGRSGDRLLLSVKGAPESVLPRCSGRRTPEGRDEPLDDDGRAGLHAMLADRAGAGHRILAVAECRIHSPSVTDEQVHELTFVGFLALADGVRESAAPAVRRIRQAGVHTIMITGDHPATAEAIASTISDHEHQRVVTATELDRLDDEALGARLAATDVVARCTPAHKVRIIQALQRCGRTVAMTGDGANDAAAIRLADVGIALGQRGTPAARAAADLVVTDDRLETIIATLVEGRAMWSSVRHALSILVGGNLGEIAFSVLTAAATGRSALTGRQLLLVNLLTDLAPALAIAVRPPDADHADGLLQEGPDTSLGETMTREIGLRAAATTLGATAGWTLARYTGRRRRAGTVALVSLVGTQLGQTVLAGGTSPAVLASTAASAGVLVAVVQTPGLSQFFGCTPLGPVGWTIATGSALGATFANGALTRLVAHLPRSEPDRPDATEPSPADDDGNAADRSPADDGDTADRHGDADHG